MILPINVYVYEKNYMRTFIHVADIARSFLFGIKNINKMVNNVYNIGNDNMNYSKEQVCNLISEKTNAFIHFEEIGSDADQRNYIVSYEKVKKLGFETTIDLNEGIDEIIKTLDVIDVSNPYVNTTK